MAEFEGSISTKPITPGVKPAADVLSAWKWPTIAAVALLALFVGMFWSFIRSQVIRAIDQQADWGHTLIVPFIVGYFVYLNRKPLLAQPFRTTWLALAPIMLGVAIYVTSITVPVLNHFNIQGFGAWVTLFGLVLLFSGFRAMRWLWFPLVYWLVFGQNISENLLQKVTFSMQDITARGSYVVLWFLGLDISRAANTITINHDGVDKPLNIAEACSGMRMLMAFLALGTAMAYTGMKKNWQRIALVLMAVPTAIIVNILRVVTLGLFSLYDINLASGDFHSFVGLVWLVPAFLIFLGLMWIILHIIVDKPPEPVIKASKVHQP